MSTWKEHWEQHGKTWTSRDGINSQIRHRISHPSFDVWRFSHVQQMLAFTPEMSVLDAGCGTGDSLVQLVGEHPVKLAVGVDFSESMLQRAVSIDSGRWLVAEVTRLPFRDSSFDASFTIGVLHYLDLQGAELAILEMGRVTKPAGRLVISFMNSRSLHGFTRGLALKILKYLGLYSSKAEVHYHSPSAMRAIAERVGNVVQEQSFFVNTILMPSTLLQFLTLVEMHLDRRSARFVRAGLGLQYFFKVERRRQARTMNTSAQPRCQ